MGARFTSGREWTVDRADRVRYPIGPPWTRQAFWYRTLAREGARPALEIARTMIDEMRDGRNSLLSGIAHRLMGASLSYAGNYVAGKPHLEKAATILEGVHDDGLITRFNDDPLVGALIRSGFDAWVSAEPERSMALTSAPSRRSSPAVTPRRSASVFQRRLASSTWAVLRSFQRRIGRLEKLIDVVRLGGLDALAGRQQDLDRRAEDPFAAGSKRWVAGFLLECLRVQIGPAARKDAAWEDAGPI